MTSPIDLVESLRAGICDDKCRSMEARSGCSCAEAADLLSSQAEALEKINAIRNSIIGFQKVSFSEHVYPLVAALQEAGIEGEEYEVARAKAQTLVDEIKAAESRIARLTGALERIASGNGLAWRGDRMPENPLSDWEMADIARQALSPIQVDVTVGK